jgi:hypothetical protein
MDRVASLEEWQLAQSEIFAKERHLAHLEVLAARGEVPASDVLRLRTDLEVLKKLTDTLFSVAFG